MDLDTYISETISIILKEKTDVDSFTLTTDLKQYILDESTNLSNIEGISINNAVENVMESIGTPEQFAEKILSEIREHKWYLISKITIASLLAFFPIIVLILVIIH